MVLCSVNSLRHEIQVFGIPVINTVWLGFGCDWLKEKRNLDNYGVVQLLMITTIID